MFSYFFLADAKGFFFFHTVFLPVFYILFIRNSLTGAIQARPRKSGIELNDALHKN